jgi:hypothetical protein
VMMQVLVIVQSPLRRDGEMADCSACREVSTQRAFYPVCRHGLLPIDRNAQPAFAKSSNALEREESHGEIMVDEVVQSRVASVALGQRLASESW